jgi:hypothetical protein
VTGNIFSEQREFPMFFMVIQLLLAVKEMWKLGKLVKLTMKWPFLDVRDEYKGETNDADSEGTRLLIWILIPLVIAYAVYQLVYSEHRSFLSYFMHCTTGAFYAFDFLLLLPQLYVNYRLKTVAGMSRSALAYKFINTIIDDLYMFLSNMPLLYKIACFRDDVVFVIWAFQCVIYPVDPTRPNEFNFVAADGDEEEPKPKIKAE